MSFMRKVVITGIGMLSPLGLDTASSWEAILQARSAAAPISKFDASPFKTQFACELKDFDPRNYFDRQSIKRYDPFAQYAMVAADQALTAACIELDAIDKTLVGVIWGSGNGGVSTFDAQMLEYGQHGNAGHFNPFFMPKILVNMAAGAISLRYGFQGINHTTVSACASATTAIIEAANYIRCGMADMMLCGGSEAPITPSTLAGFNALKALSTRNDDPATASRPFDVARDGFVMGEGAAALVLESEEHAMQRGAHILAEFAGGGMATEAYHLTGTHPEGEGALLGMSRALDNAGLPATAIDYINAHATSTPMGDESEMKAIARLFTNPTKRPLISATKSMTGHLLGAAGALEAALCIKAIQQNTAPPTINTLQLDPACEVGFDLCLQQAVKKDIKVAMSNTFGFGGHIASVIFKRYEASL
jgi:3-oxoacyl-[acyl-carrier-protein] synthase II